MTLAAVTLALASGCSGADDDDDKRGSSSGGSSSGSSGASSSGGSSSGDPSKTESPTEPTKKEIGAQCKESSDCKSDFCVFSGGGGALGMCTQTCDSSIDCPGLGYDCVRLSDAPQKVCVPE